MVCIRKERFVLLDNVSVVICLLEGGACSAHREKIRHSHEKGEELSSFAI